MSNQPSTLTAATAAATIRPMELKLGQSSAFNSDTVKARAWLNNVQIYLHVNKAVYNDNEKMIAYALCFIQQLPQGVQGFLHPRKCQRPGNCLANKHPSHQQPPPHRIYFTIQKQHCPQWNNKSRCPDKLLLKRNPGTHHEKGALNGQSLLQLRSGIPKHSTSNSPGKGQKLSPREEETPSSHFKEATRKIKHISDLNTMDINAACLEQLIPEERQKWIENNLCFKCRKPGHSTAKCRNPFVNKMRQPTTSAIAKIKEIPNDDFTTFGRITTLDF